MKRSRKDVLIETLATAVGVIVGILAVIGLMEIM